MLARLLYRYLRPYRWFLFAVLILEFAAALASLYLPSLNADIVNDGVVTGDTDFIWSTGLRMLLVSFGQIIAALAATVCAAAAAMRMGRDIRNDVFRRVSGFSEREISRFGAGSLITRNTNDVQQVQMLAMMAATMLIMAPMLAIGGIIMALRQELSLAWIIAVSVPVLLIIAIAVVWRMVPLFRAYQVKLDAVNRVMREQLTGVRVVRAFVREQIEAARFRVANTDIMIVGRKVGSLFVLMFPLAMLVLNLTIVAVVWFGAETVDTGEAEIGSIFAFMQYIGMILMGVLMASFMTIMIPRAAVSAERISEVLATESALVNPQNPVREFPQPGHVEFRDVTLTYPGAESPVLQQVSFTAAPGQTVAVIGSTGAGKTTLVSLIPRLFDTSSGQVLVGGVPTEQADLELLWQQIGLVPQRSFLFTGTVASNLRLGRPEATDAELWQALEIAQGADFVRDLADGLETRVSQGGTNFSGGQRQRLAIARAIVKKPAVLVFDDSFSALDLATDARLRAALWRELPQVTKIVVAQRVSTITDADLIVVLDGGRVVGQGTHQQLLVSTPTYREIVESQLGAEVES